MYKEGKAGALCSFEVDKLTSDKDESNVNGHAESRQIDLDSSVLFNMPRPKDDAPDHKVAVKSDDSWIGWSEHVQGRGAGSEGDGHDLARPTRDAGGA